MHGSIRKDASEAPDGTFLTSVVVHFSRHTHVNYTILVQRNRFLYEHRSEYSLNLPGDWFIKDNVSLQTGKEKYEMYRKNMYLVPFSTTEKA